MHQAACQVSEDPLTTMIHSAGNLYIRNAGGPYFVRDTMNGIHLKRRAVAYQGWAAIYRRLAPSALLVIATAAAMLLLN